MTSCCRVQALHIQSKDHDDSMHGNPGSPGDPMQPISRRSAHPQRDVAQEQQVVGPLQFLKPNPASERGAVNFSMVEVSERVSKRDAGKPTQREMTNYPHVRSHIETYEGGSLINDTLPSVGNLSPGNSSSIFGGPSRGVNRNLRDQMREPFPCDISSVAPLDRAFVVTF